MKRVVICGSRGWDDPMPIMDRVTDLGPKDIVIHGCAEGADTIAGKIAREIGLHTAEVRPLWDHFGRRAGHIRNAAMLDLEPDLVIAFSLDTPGTKGTIKEARKRGIPVEVIQAERSGAPNPKEVVS